jgi:hypothetical protein
VEKLGAIERATQKVLNDTEKCLATIRKLSNYEGNSIDRNIAALIQLRKEIYEDLNQIQPEYLIVRAAEWLILGNHRPVVSEWFWNPRQTGTSLEPDLEGRAESDVIVSAEVTSSEKPKGTIRTRMRSTLKKLSEMNGEKLYFVRTEAMFDTAQGQILQSGWKIEVVLLADRL